MNSFITVYFLVAQEYSVCLLYLIFFHFSFYERVMYPDSTISRMTFEKDFFNNDFRDLSQTDLDTLVRSGVVHDELVTSGGLPSHHYIFNNHDDLMRLSKTYSKLVPKVERALANEKPLGNENMESYIERITKKVYQTDDGTFYGLKDDVNWDERVARSFNNSRNVYGNTTYPRMGIYSGSNYYSPNRAMASRVVNNIIMNHMTNRWTH